MCVAYMDPENDVAAIAHVVVCQRHGRAVFLGINHLLMLVSHQRLEAETRTHSSTHRFCPQLEAKADAFLTQLCFAICIYVQQPSDVLQRPWHVSPNSAVLLAICINAWWNWQLATV